MIWRLAYQRLSLTLCRWMFVAFHHDLFAAGAAAGTFCFQIGMRHAMFVEPEHHSVPGYYAVLVDLHPQHPTGEVFRVRKSVEQEVSQAVNSWTVPVAFGSLRDVRMRADDDVGPSVDH